MKISGKQVAAARELLGITQTELGQSAGLALKTISNFEAGHAEPYPVNLEKIRAELERRGIEFTNGDSPPSVGEGTGVRLNHAKAAAFARVKDPNT
jgi:transcriptional regulator with XRE-family HTH domain